MIIKILFILANIWYWIGEGATEGYTWSSKERRNENKIIGINGILDYHGWRVIGENLGILFMIITAYYLSSNLIILIGLLYLVNFT